MVALRRLLATAVTAALASGLTKEDVDLGAGTRLTSSVSTSGGDHLLDVLLTTKREVADKRTLLGRKAVGDADLRRGGAGGWPTSAGTAFPLTPLVVR